MRQIKFFLAVLILSQSIIFSQSGWYQVNSGTSMALFQPIFLNANTGFVFGTNGISSSIFLKTTNTGINWNIISNLNYRINSYQFINLNLGFAVCDSQKILKTTNGGFNWNVIHSGPYATAFRTISFIDQNTGYVAGVLAEMLKTTDGGGTFINPVLGNPFNANTISKIIFTDALTGHVTTSGNYKIFRTTNGGINWSITGYPFLDINDIQFINSQSGFAIGAFSPPNIQFCLTNNSGASWSVNVVNIGFQSTFYGIYFTDLNTGYAAGSQGKIITTTDGGTNWLPQNSGVTNFLTSVFFINSLTGFITGSSGLLLKTTDAGGLVGLNSINTEVPNNFSLSQNYPNPFNPVTKIKFDISGKSVTQTFLSVYDILGREVEVLVNELLRPGTYEVDFDGSNYPSGIYYYKLQAGDFTETRKMVLIK